MRSFLIALAAFFAIRVSSHPVDDMDDRQPLLNRGVVQCPMYPAYCGPDCQECFGNCIPNGSDCEKYRHGRKGKSKGKGSSKGGGGGTGGGLPHEPVD